MTKNEKRLAAELLEQAADKFGNHTCNDFNRPEWFPKNEWDAMHKRMYEANGDPENYHPSEYSYDSFLMSYLADLIRES